MRRRLRPVPPHYLLPLLLLPLPLPLPLPCPSPEPLARVSLVKRGHVPPAEEALHQAVLQGVEGEHAQATAGPQQRLGGAQPRVQLVHLVVDKDAQSLEGLGGHVGRALQLVLARVESGARERSFRERRQRNREHP